MAYREKRVTRSVAPSTSARARNAVTRPPEVADGVADLTELLCTIDEALTDVQRRFLVASVRTPPLRVDPARELLHGGTRALFMNLGILDDDGYLTELGTAVGLAFGDDDLAAAEYGAEDTDDSATMYKRFVTRSTATESPALPAEAT